MKNKQKQKEYQKLWLLKHPHYFRNWVEKNRKWREKYHKKWCENNPDKIKQYKKRADDRHYYKGWFRKERLDVLCHYSNGKNPFCICCGETIYEFLAIDHINGCGKEQRRKEMKFGNLFRYLKKNNYPKGYQILCHNCNSAKGYNGFCPHQLNNK